jgi:hypothetical protein
MTRVSCGVALRFARDSLFFKRGAVNGGASSAARSRFAADSLLVGAVYCELVSEMKITGPAEIGF